MTEEQLKNMAAQLRKPQGEDGVKTADLMNKANKHIIEDCFDVLHAETNDNILEIGMGDGYYVKDLLNRSPDIRYTGCDYSSLMIEMAEKVNAHWISLGQAKFLQTDGKTLPFENKVFNKVITINTIYFWENETATLTEIKRVLQDEGKLIIAFRPKHQMEKYPFTKYGFKQYSKEDVEALILDNGFQLEGSFENEESDFDSNGQPMTRENVVVVARKV